MQKGIISILRNVFENYYDEIILNISSYPFSCEVNRTVLILACCSFCYIL